MSSVYLNKVLNQACDEHDMVLCEIVFIIVVLCVVHTYGVGLTCDGTNTELVATGDKAFITSPNYPNQYHDNELCKWVIEAREDYEVVRLRVQDLQIKKSAMCSDDYVEVRDGKNNWSPSIRRWCDSKDIGSLTTSTEQAVLITFRSNSQLTDAGFKIEYWSVPKGTVEYLPVKLDRIHYFLFAVFGIIMSSIILTMVTIAVLRNHRLPRAVLRPRPRRKTIHVAELDGQDPDFYCDAINDLQFRISGETMCENISNPTESL